MTEPAPVTTTPDVTVTLDFESAYEALANGKGSLFQSKEDAKGTIYVIAKTPAKAMKLLIDYLDIKIEQMSLTDANLQFLNLQRTKSAATPTIDQPS